MIKVTSNPYYYQRQLPHYQKQHCILFVTFCKLLPVPFSEAARSLVLRHCLHDNGKKLRMHAAVVMPEHVHLLLTPLPDPEGRVYLLMHMLKLIIRNVCPQREQPHRPLRSSLAGGIVRSRPAVG